MSFKANAIFFFIKLIPENEKKKTYWNVVSEFVALVRSIDHAFSVSNDV